MKARLIDVVGDKRMWSRPTYAMSMGVLFGIILGTIAALILLVTGCSPPPKQGVVMSTEYNRAHYDEYMYCGMYDKHMMCQLWLTGHEWVPDEWSLKLKDGKHTGWRGVPKSVYDGPCGQLGSHYPECMS